LGLHIHTIKLDSFLEKLFFRRTRRTSMEILISGTTSRGCFLASILVKNEPWVTNLTNSFVVVIHAICDFGFDLVAKFVFQVELSSTFFAGDFRSVDLATENSLWESHTRRLVGLQKVTWFADFTLILGNFEHFTLTDL